MATTLFTATAREQQLIQAVLDQVRGLRQNPAIRPTEEPPPDAAPDLYVAKLAEAVTQVNPISRDYLPGTGTGTGTGPGVEDSPGYALCDLYRIVLEENSPRFLKVRQSERVYNVSPSVVTSDWFLAARTKFGQWVAVGLPNDRWEFALLLDSASEGVQAANSIHALVTKGPYLGHAETGERVAIDYVMGRAVDGGEYVTLQWKWGGVYALPLECSATGTGTGA